MKEEELLRVPFLLTNNMKLLVVSDSHFYNEYLKNVLKKHKNDVDILIHCGDSSLDIQNSLIQQFDYIVQGNHDSKQFPCFEIFQNIFITHGHLFHIYKGYEELIELCQRNQCQICFHGHTHIPTYQIHQGIHFINPGSLMINRGTYGYGTYAIVEINAHMPIQVKFYHHISHKECSHEIIKEGLIWLEEFKKIA